MAMSQQRVGRSVLVWLAIGATCMMGCVSRAKPDGAQQHPEESRARADETADALKRCEQASSNAAAALAASTRKNEELEIELGRVRDQLTEREAAATQAQAVIARHVAYAAELEAHVRRLAKTFQLRAADVRRGKLLELVPGVAPRGELARYLRPSSDTGDQLALGIDAVVHLGKLPVERLLVALEGGRVSNVELAIKSSGKPGVAEVRALIGELCKNPRWKHGRPGPGSPKVDPVTGQRIPLVAISTAECTRTAAAWEIMIRGKWVHDGAALDRIELTVLFASKALGNPPR